jgi:hypothetical protein
MPHPVNVSEVGDAVTPAGTLRVTVAGLAPVALQPVASPGGMVLLG